MIKIGNNLSEWSAYSCQPKTKDELAKIIGRRIVNEGYECDLNDIDVSLITEMNSLFYQSKFNGDISKWDVSKVTNMQRMFQDSSFNQDISKWKINRACNITDMFHRCQIKKEFKPKPAR